MLLVRYSLLQWYCRGGCCEGALVCKGTPHARALRDRHDASHDGQGPLSGSDGNCVTAV